MIERTDDGTLVNADTGEVVALLTADEAEELTSRIVTAADALWELLWESYHREAWRALGYPSWRAYAGDRFGMSHSKAYRLLHHAGIVKELEAAGAAPDGGVTEHQSRALRKGRAAADLDAARDATGKESPSGDDIRAHRDPAPVSPVGEPDPPPGSDLPRYALALESLVGLIIEEWPDGDDTSRVSVKRSTRRLADHLNASAKPKPAPVKPKREARPVPKKGR